MCIKRVILKIFKLDKMVNTVHITQLIIFYLFPNSNHALVHKLSLTLYLTTVKSMFTLYIQTIKEQYL